MKAFTFTSSSVIGSCFTIVGGGCLPPLRFIIYRDDRIRVYFVACIIHIFTSMTWLRS